MVTNWLEKDNNWWPRRHALSQGRRLTEFNIAKTASKLILWVLNSTSAERPATAIFHYTADLPPTAQYKHSFVLSVN